MTDKTFDKYKAVVDEWFVNGFNGTKAYQKIYPKAKQETAEVNISKILSLTKVQDYISQKHAKAQEYSELTHQEIISELEGFAMLDTTKIVSIGEKKESIVVKDKNGNPRLKTIKSTGVIIKSFNELSDIERRSIISIKETKHGIEITFFKKETAFEMLNRQKGIYEKDNKQKTAPAFMVFDARKKQSE